MVWLALVHPHASNISSYELCIEGIGSGRLEITNLSNVETTLRLETSSISSHTTKASTTNTISHDTLQKEEQISRLDDRLLIMIAVDAIDDMS